MREILFRGKRIDNGKWVTGMLCQYHDSVKAVIGINHFGVIDTVDMICVHPATVGQYTGLTDKNGKKIFEGDIIKASNEKRNVVAVVKYGNFRPAMIYKMFLCCLGYEPSNDLHGVFYESATEQMMLVNYPICIEVIGNIHDNPDLLEEATP